jgi:hypothetical protein
MVRRVVRKAGAGAWRCIFILRCIIRSPILGSITLSRSNQDLDQPAALDHTLLMPTSSLGRWMVAGIAVCVLLLFLFPVMQGSFQETHGPTTAFRARRALLILIFSVVYGALGVFDHFPLPVSVLTLRYFRSCDSISCGGSATRDSVALRC